HSTARSAITRSEHISNLQHDILPRNYYDPAPLKKRGSSLSNSPLEIIKHDDIVRIQFTAYNTTFHLHLEPNLDLIHPEADFGEHKISKDEIMAFKGVVVQDEDHSDIKWDRAARTSRMEKRSVEHMLHEGGVLGWARMMIEHDPENENSVVLRGAFMADGDTYHVTPIHTYHIQKRSEDAVPPTSQLIGPNLVVYRDSDLYTRSNSLRRKRGLEREEESSCGSDSLAHGGRTGINPEAQVTHEYYHPPNLTTSIPLKEGMDLSSSWDSLWNKGSLNKREISIRAVGPDPVPEGCPANRLVNYMGVAADCTYVRTYGGAANARKQILADFNTASGIYESTFNVALGVVTLNIVPDGCPATPVKGEEWNQDCTSAYSIDQRLSDFSAWRGLSTRSSDGAGLWHLMTKCNSGPVVGIAWTKALCQMKSQKQKSKGVEQVTAGTGVSSITTNEWMVVAHEIGHGFGAIHDCTQQTCGAKAAGDQCCPLSPTTCDAGARFIMNPSESTATKLFSPCSIKTICTTISSSTGSCLKPPGTRDIQNSGSNICGNGIKETGEECDCGSAEDCAKDPCCDGATCKLKNGAICDDLNDSCCQNCQLRPAGQVCRKSVSECDIEEVCSGNNATCPSDQYKSNLTPCGTSNSTELWCANGYCTSRDLQCQQQDRPGVTKQCGSSMGCDLTCNDPSGSALNCIQVQGAYFVDGTSCGIGGTCERGECKFSGSDGFIHWIKSHLYIVIPVASILGLMFLCCLWSCCCGGCQERRRQKRMKYKAQRLGSVGHDYSNFVPPAPPQGQYPPPQHYPMEPVSSMPAPPPTYQSHSQNNTGNNTGYYPRDSSDSHDNPFGNHNAQHYGSYQQQQQQQQQRPAHGGYI
ncbi:hypothetical protein BGZ76_007252, partial [Entomortierella beljakovae]